MFFRLIWPYHICGNICCPIIFGVAPSRFQNKCGFVIRPSFTQLANNPLRWEDPIVWHLKTFPSNTFFGQSLNCAIFSRLSWMRRWEVSRMKWMWNHSLMGLILLLLSLFSGLEGAPPHLVCSFYSQHFDQQLSIFPRCDGLDGSASWILDLVDQDWARNQHIFWSWKWKYWKSCWVPNSCLGKHCPLALSVSGSSIDSYPVSY